MVSSFVVFFYDKLSHPAFTRKKDWIMDVVWQKLGMLQGSDQTASVCRHRVLVAVPTTCCLIVKVSHEREPSIPL